MNKYVQHVAQCKGVDCMNYVSHLHTFFLCNCIVYGEALMNPSPTLLYDFLKGHPNKDELPVDELYNLFQSVDHKALRSSLQYGQECGHPPLITELKSFLDRQCANDIGICCSSSTIGSRSSSNSSNSSSISQKERSLFITEGVSHGIDLITTIASKPGDLVMTEHPTYFLVANIFRTHHLHVTTMPMNMEDNTTATATSIDFDRLEHMFQLGNVPRLIYIIPAYQNPTGRSMSTMDRERLTRLSHQYKILVIADEVYHLLDWMGSDHHHHHRPKRMVLWNDLIEDEAENESSLLEDNKELNTRQPTTALPSNLLYGLVSVSSFTKIFGPGVRCGWIEAETHIIRAIQENSGYIQSQGAVGPVMSSIMTVGLVNRTVDRVLQRLREQYQIRCSILCDIIERETKLELTCRPSGGYFIWIKFPTTMNEKQVRDFYDYCLDHGVRYMPGTRCCSSSGQESAIYEYNESSESLHSYARLCFAKMNTIDIEKGGEFFVNLFRSFIDTISD